MSSWIRDLRQVCVVADDLDGTLEVFASLGIGPWSVFEAVPPQLFGTRLDGEPAAWTIRLAVAWIGRMQLEVIQPLEGDSIHRRFLERGPGVHHALVTTTDPPARAEARLAGAGYPVAQEGRFNAPVRLGRVTIPAPPAWLARRFATRFVYLDTERTLGTMLELAAFPPGVSFDLAMRIGKPGTVRAAAGRPVFGSVDAIGLTAAQPHAVRDAWSDAGVKSWHPDGDGWSAELPTVRLDVSRAEGSVRIATITVTPLRGVGDAVERLTQAGGRVTAEVDDAVELAPEVELPPFGTTRLRIRG